MSSNNKTLALRWGKTVGAGTIIALLGMIMLAILRAHNRRMLPYKPMITEAINLNLDFDTVTSNPDKYIEKYAIWCVQNLAKGQTYYRGDSRRSIYVFNHQQMPIFTGYKHTICTDMLLQIKGVRPSGDNPGSVGAMFIKEMH